ncbi:MAG: hypothetical protein J0L99_09715 [Chitinophagales bacterium]|nr:hypothetical protein [Chitinophagales bacterium]
MDANNKFEMKIDLNISRNEIIQFYTDSQGMLPGLSELLSTTDLHKLIEKHIGTEYENALYESIACHKNVDEHLHLKIIVLSNNAPEVANGVATSGKCSKLVLNHLLNHSYQSVREHAKLALKLLM